MRRADVLPTNELQQFADPHAAPYVCKISSMASHECRRGQWSANGLPASISAKRLCAADPPRVCATTASPDAPATERRRQLWRPAAACWVRPSDSRRATSVRRAAAANWAAVWHAAIATRCGWRRADCSGATRSRAPCWSALHRSSCPRPRVTGQGRDAIIDGTDADTNQMMTSANNAEMLYQASTSTVRPPSYSRMQTADASCPCKC